jgi:hypothetical protein
LQFSLHWHQYSIWMILLMFLQKREQNCENFQGLQPLESLFLTSDLETWSQDEFLLKKKKYCSILVEKLDS